MANDKRNDLRPEGGDPEELRMQRTEEEIEVGVREREAGSMNVRKNVRTEREEVRVPKRREEVEVERVPAEGEAREVPEAQIGEDEFVVQVFEEEVVVSKRVVLKEEIRLRKKVIEDEEVVEVDLQKEEVEIDNQTNHGAGPAWGWSTSSSNPDDVGQQSIQRSTTRRKRG